MKTAALVLGIIGGVIGLTTVIATFFGTAFLAAFVDKIKPEQVILISSGVFLFSILGIIGGGLVRSKPIIGSIFMFVSAIGGIIISFGIYTLAAIFFFVGGIISLMSRNEK